SAAGSSRSWLRKLNSWSGLKRTICGTQGSSACVKVTTRKTCTAKFRCLRLNRPSLEGKENYDYGDNDYRGCSVACHCCPLQSKSPPSPLPFKILNRPPIYGDNQN